MLLLHGAPILSAAYDKQSIFSVKQLYFKSGKWEKLFQGWDYFGGKWWGYSRNMNGEKMYS